MLKNAQVLAAIAIVGLVTVGCGKGSLSIGGEDAGGSPRDGVSRDVGLDGTRFTVGDAGGETPDIDQAGEDGGSDTGNDVGADPGPECVAGGCGEGASCVEGMCRCDDGLLGDPTVECTSENPCADVNCNAGASCNPDGSCSCDPFFEGDGTTCEPQAPPANLEDRSADDVCAIWRSQYSRSSNEFFLIEPADECDPGVLHPEEHREALHTTSKFRMLVGLYPVSLAQNRVGIQQECATMHAAEGSGLNHDPPSSWACYTQDGASGAGSSNLAFGIASPAATVPLYIRDSGVPSLGHRRWVFNPSMDRTTFGHRESYGCMYAFARGRQHAPEFVAYPAPGPFPIDAVLGQWSIHGGGAWRGDHTVEIVEVGSGDAVEVTDVNAPQFGSLAPTLAWTVSGGLSAGESYRIQIFDAAGELAREYTTTLVSCP